MTIGNGEVELISAKAVHEIIEKLLADPKMETLHSGLIDPDYSQAKRVDRLFHLLWTKAVSADDYDKAQWTELGNILSKAG